MATVENCRAADKAGRKKTTAKKENTAAVEVRTWRDIGIGTRGEETTWGRGLLGFGGEMEGSEAKQARKEKKEKEKEMSQVQDNALAWLY
uniref:Uncharacterized protein n=1 Tax=Oryza brachyantha TaxID=4533 RepID=J3MPQ2_ORYBR